MKKVLPDASVYHWAKKEEQLDGGKVYAKVAVADGSICFLSSANLPGHAMKRNMEAGILISGGTISASIHDHVEALVTINQIQIVN